ncbi:MAG: divalent metal cation transporter [Thiocapsa sp.]|uniref:NRAMP family divalent metal transporter n=1 Tax=Thiocapsa sp. TaxID=2024551 RepID=UPI001BCD5EC9|nr:divalent metal cation transporter [Thiocapsa sp.]QVL48302.1 MAG: divalent metal cation transporter [Thiocapsa sp.]
MIRRRTDKPVAGAGETAPPHSARSRSAVFWLSFGPGLLWAGASIGVSHLVQSTRAGALAGFGLAGFILLALVLKYPFFEFGPRYAAATGKSLVEGYRRIGSWALWLYLFITLATALIVQVAVVMFTAYLLNIVFGIQVPLALTGGAICLAAVLMLWLGRYRLLDASMKVVMALLAVSTLVAAVVTLPSADYTTFEPLPRFDPNIVELGFLLALMGWMPTAIDLSVWSSLWTLAKDRSTGSRSSVSSARLDFNIGYIGTGILAFAFLALGATVMHGAGIAFDPSGPLFAGQLLDLYVGTLGDWARPIVLIALLTTMISTSITVIDGFPRAIDRSIQVLSQTRPGPIDDIGRTYWIALILLAVLTVIVLQKFLGNLTGMVDFAATLSFITAPILGYLNLRAVTSDEMPLQDRPGRAMILFSYVGLILLTAFAGFYLISRLL